MAGRQLHLQLKQWAEALAGDQVVRTVRRGDERIHMAATAHVATDVMRIEIIVQRMEAAGRWKEARVLRTEYFLAGLSEGDRLAYLARQGTSISRASYYAYLTSAKAFVEGALCGSAMIHAA